MVDLDRGEKLLIGVIYRAPSSDDINNKKLISTMSDIENYSYCKQWMILMFLMLTGMTFPVLMLGAHLHWILLIPYWIAIWHSMFWNQPDMFQVRTLPFLI